MRCNPHIQERRDRGAIVSNIYDEGVKPPPPPIFLGLTQKQMVRFAPVKNVLRSVKLKQTIWKSQIIKLVALKHSKCSVLIIRFVNIVVAMVLLLSLLLNNMLMTFYSLL